MQKINSFQDIDQALLDVGKLEVELTKKEAALNSRVQEIRDKFDKETKDLREEKKLLDDEIEKFCFKNRGEFEHQRTRTLVHGLVGFRTNPPKIVQLSSKYKIAMSIGLIKKIFDGIYVRTKEEINKEEILTDYATKKLDDKKLSEIGLRVEQEETFIKEINWESLDKSDTNRTA